MKYMLKNKDYHIFIVLLLSSIVYFIGNTWLSITDPVETNYALTAKEMVLNHNYLSPQIFGHYWYDKPIFYYWELIVGFKLFGISNFGARFFSSLLALCNVFLVYRFVKAQSSHIIAILSAIIVSISAEYWIIAKAVITDMTLSLFFNATLMSFYMGYTRHKEHNKNYKFYYLSAYTASAIAVLTKGPIGFLLPGLIILIYLIIRKDLRELLSLQLIPGLFILLTLGGSWYYYMYATHGSDFVNVFFGVHNWLRATVSEHPKFNVWYYYIPITIIALLPWSILLPKLVYTNRRNWFTNVPFHTFLAVWAGTIILFFSCMATKYSTYTFPALTPLAILMANISHYISQSINHDALIVQGSGRYRVSSTYYSDHKVYKLIGADEVAPDPNTISWNAKEVMPFISVNNLPKDKDIYLLIYGDDSFPSTLNQNHWKKIYSTAEGSIYQLHRIQKN
ncbi:MAG: glycosyltransferase family 39 protein [Veillonella sp.]|nr:glycosyltransferase family 39 protein [Veillonella sp.]